MSKDPEEIKKEVEEVVAEKKCCNDDSDCKCEHDENNEHYVIFHVEGGLGKNIMATAIVEVIKKHYPNSIIIVVSPWEDPWVNNPNVNRIYKNMEAKYFRRDYIHEDTKIFRMDPYFTEDHILKRYHLLETWCRMYGMKYNGEMPKLYLTPREMLQAQSLINTNQNDTRPILLMQTNGGASNSPFKYSWTREIPVHQGQQLVNTFVEKGYRVLQVRSEEQIQLQNTESLHPLGPRQLFAVIKLSDKRLFIDSFAQHAAAAFGLKSTVVWVKTDPEIFGYAMHNNIRATAKEVIENDKHAYLFDYDFNGPLAEFPYENLDVFNIKEIVENVEKN